MSERASYSRVYWGIVDDPKFVTIYDDDHHLAAWMRLLLIADQAHPASAHLPVNVRKSSVAELADVGLIDLLPGSRYRVHGLDAERERRREFATSRPRTVPAPKPERSPDGDRTVPEPDRSGPGTRGLRRDETRLDEPSIDEEPDEWPALQWLSKWGCEVRPGNGYHRKLVTAVEVHGVEAIVATFERLAKAGVKRGDIKGFVFGAIDALNEPSRPKLRAVESSDAHQRGVERTKIRAHENGLHDTPNPGCPRCAA